MNLSLYIAKRYLFSKKSHNAINIVSIISACGVAVGTIALVCVLSVFNGFQGLVENLFSNFDPPIKITLNQGKTFDTQLPEIQRIKKMPEVAFFGEVLQENALLMFSDKQTPVIVKGVSENYGQISDIDKIMMDGSFKLTDGVFDMGVAGIGLAQTLGCGVRFVEPLQLYAPKRNSSISIIRPDEAFNKQYLFLSGIFMVQQAKYDSNLLLVRLSLARKLFEYNNEVTSIELKLAKGTDGKVVQQKIQKILGKNFSVKNKYEQQEDFFRMTKVEKWITYLILSFILLIAIFNVIGSLSMLIIEKKKDIIILENMGASRNLIFKIFLFEGWMISIIGVIIGIILGLILCYLQMEFGLISLGGESGAYIVNAYPVQIEWFDILIIAITVLSLGFLAAIYPARTLSKQDTI